MNLENARESLGTENGDPAESRLSSLGPAGAIFDDIDLQRAGFNDINLAGTTSPGNTGFCIRDPDGHVLAFASR